MKLLLLKVRYMPRNNHIFALAYLIDTQYVLYIIHEHALFLVVYNSLCRTVKEILNRLAENFSTLQSRSSAEIETKMLSTAERKWTKRGDEKEISMIETDSIVIFSDVCNQLVLLHYFLYYLTWKLLRFLKYILPYHNTHSSSTNLIFFSGVFKKSLFYSVFSCQDFHFLKNHLLDNSTELLLCYF